MIDFILNPKAGRGKTIKCKKFIEDELTRLKIPFCIHETQYKKHATEIAEKLTKSGSTDIVAVGGDGTVHEVLNGIVDLDKVRFGIIGTGTGNDFISVFQGKKTPLQALNIILGGKTKKIDYMDCSGVRGINIIGTGIDVEILERCLSSKFLKGKLQYINSLIISLIKFKYHEFTVEMNNKAERRTTLISCICNGTTFGGGIPICKDAVIGDGILNYVFIGEVKKSRIPIYFLKLMKGTLIKQKDVVTTGETDSYKITFDKPTSIQIDGEIYHDLPFDVKIVKDKLNIFCE